MTALQTYNRSAEVALPNPEDVLQLRTALTELSRAWRETPPGQPIQHGMTDSQLRERLQLLQQAQAIGSVQEVGHVVKRLLLNYWPAGKPVPQTVVQDWVRHLIDQPFASIFECYERQIRSTDDWAPRVGQFLEKVQRHSQQVKHIEDALRLSIADRT